MRRPWRRSRARTEVEFFPAGTTIIPQGRASAGPHPGDQARSRGAPGPGHPRRPARRGRDVRAPLGALRAPRPASRRGRGGHPRYSLAAEDVIPLLGQPSSLRFLTRSLLAQGRPRWRRPDRASQSEVAQQPASALVRRPPVICHSETTLREAARPMDAEDVERGPRRARARRLRDRHRQRPPLEGRRGPALTRRSGERGHDDARLRSGRGPDRRGRDDGHARSRHPARPGLLAALRGARGDRRNRPGRRRDRSPFVLRRAIARAKNKHELTRRRRRLNATVVALHRAELPPSQISEVISAVADSLIGRMIELAIESQGPPPAEFCWMSLGSHGRREPVPSSDVDSGMAWRDVPENDPLTSAARRRSRRPGPAIHARDRGQRRRLRPGASAGGSIRMA